MRVDAAPVLTTLTITPTPTSIKIGYSIDFSVEGFDQYGDPVEIDPVWSTAQGNEINQEGEFRAVNVGRTSVTVSAGGKTQTHSIVVLPPLNNIALNKPVYVSSEENGGTFIVQI